MNSVRRSLLLFGKCVTPDIPSAVRVIVGKYVLDERIVMYFWENEIYYAKDPKQECQPGDYVLIRDLENTKPKKITHIVEKLVYRLGYTIDPITGKRCAGDEYIDDIKRTCEFFGTMPKYLKEESSTSNKQVEK